jgi:hypothetical protein
MNTYSCVEGTARTKASGLAILATVMPVVVFIIWTAFLVNIATTTKSEPLALLGALIVVFVMIGFMTFQILSQKWAYARLADSVVALLVRTL